MCQGSISQPVLMRSCLTVQWVGVLASGEECGHEMCNILYYCCTLSWKFGQLCESYWFLYIKNSVQQTLGYSALDRQLIVSTSDFFTLNSLKRQKDHPRPIVNLEPVKPWLSLHECGTIGDLSKDVEIVNKATWLFDDVTMISRRSLKLMNRWNSPDIIA